MHLVMSWTDTIVLGIWRSTEEVGVYNVALKTAALLSLFIVAVSSIAAPKFAEIHASGDSATLERFAQDVVKVLSALAFPVLLLFLIWPGQVLQLFGGEFAAGASALRVLSLGHFVNVALGGAAHLLVMTGHEKSVRNITIVTALLNLGMNLVLVPRFGPIGAAVATSVSLVTVPVLAAMLSAAKLGIHIVPLRRMRRAR
jgi:O-antigen/teichoic acid export membrane protein